MNTSALYSCFLRQPLELSLKKNFQLLRCQNGNGDRGGLARRRLDLQAVRGFRVLGIRSHATPLSGATKGGGRVRVRCPSILARPAVSDWSDNEMTVYRSTSCSMLGGLNRRRSEERRVGRDGCAGWS